MSNRSSLLTWRGLPPGRGGGARFFWAPLLMDPAGPGGGQLLLVGVLHGGGALRRRRDERLEAPGREGGLHHGLERHAQALDQPGCLGSGELGHHRAPWLGRPDGRCSARGPAGGAGGGGSCRSPPPSLDPALPVERPDRTTPPPGGDPTLAEQPPVVRRNIRTSPSAPWSRGC